MTAPARTVTPQGAMLIGISRTRCSLIMAFGFGSGQMSLPVACVWNAVPPVADRTVGIGEVAAGDAEAEHFLRHVHPRAVGRSRAGPLNFHLDVAAKHRLFVIAFIDPAVELAAGRTRQDTGRLIAAEGRTRQRREHPGIVAV